MKILLVNPVLNDKKIVNVIPNLGLAYLATSLRKNDFELELFDGLKSGMNKKKLQEKLNSHYDVVGLQIFTFVMEEIREYLKIIKSKNKDSIIVVGGPHPSGDPEGTLNYLPEIDFVFKGESDVAFPLFLKEIQKGNNASYDKIPNLVWRKNGKVIVNSISYIQDLDSLGFPSWDLIDPREYPHAPIGAFVKSFPVAGVIASRGCPYKCTFCAGHSIMGRNLRIRNPNKVVEEIELLNKKYKVKEIHIVDDNFTLKKDFATEVCSSILEKELNINIAFPNGVRLGTLDEEILKMLEKAGCYSLSLGIESGSERILKHMKKRQTIDEIKEKVSLITRVTKIRVTGFFIIGYPEEEEEDILKTIELSKNLNLSRAQFAMYLPIPGTEMYEKLKEEGKVNSRNFSSTIFQNTDSYVPIKISLSSFKKLRQKAYREFYLRPKIILGLLKEIKSFQQLKYIIRRIFKLF